MKLLFLPMLMVLALLLPGQEASDDKMSLSEKRGRLIYQKGESEGGKIKLLLSNSDLEMPATSFPCGYCHGGNGEGTSEGGLEPPPVRWQDLMSEAQSTFSGSDRPPYTIESLEAAILHGKDPSGRPLHPGMPRYRMSDRQLDDLLAYLRIIGKGQDLDPGITSDSIVLGSVLPLTGSKAKAGARVRHALEIWAADLNSGGGVFGRSIDLRFEDSASTPSGAFAAIERLILNARVFALFACHIPRGAVGVEALIGEHEVPLIGPITISPRPTDPPNRWCFYMLTSIYDQARTLVEYLHIAEEMNPERVALLSSEVPIHAEARAGALRQLKIFDCEPVLETVYDPESVDFNQLAKVVRDREVTAVIFLGSGSDTARFSLATTVTGGEFPLLTIGSAIGRDAFLLPPERGPLTLISFPTSIFPNPRDLQWVVELAEKGGLEFDLPSLQGPALASARLLLEGFKLSGRRVSREGLIEILEGIRGFRTGLIPSLDFSPNQRIGALGSHLLSIDVEGGRFQPVTGWITPRTGATASARGPR